MSYAARIARYVNEDFLMFSGNDDIVLPMMALGASGVISVWANVMPLDVPIAWFGAISTATTTRLSPSSFVAWT